MAAESHEHTFMQEGDIIITSKRVTVGGKTIMVSDIQAVEVSKKSNRAYPIALLIFGLVAVSGGIALLNTSGLGWLVLLAGAASVAAAIFLFTLSKTEYSVVLTTASSEITLLSSLDSDFIDQVTDAVRQATASA